MRRWRALALIVAVLGATAVPATADWYQGPWSGLGHVLPTTYLTVDGTLDLDGDGGTDLIQSASNGGYRARSGASGRVLWTAPAIGDTEEVYVARVGKPARPGVVIAEWSETAEPLTWPPKTRTHLTYTAYDGATGAHLWQVERTGLRWNPNPTGLGYERRYQDDPAPLEAVTGRHGRAALFLFTETSTDDAGKDTRALFRISGASGAVADLETTRESFEWPYQLRDIDRDGYAEFSVMAPHFVVLSGRTGHELWDLPRPTSGAAAKGLPDLTGDRAPEVAILLDEDDHESELVVNGKNGKTLWAASTYLRESGDIDSDGFMDFVEHEAVLRNGDYYASRFRGISGHSGSTIWRRTMKAYGPSSDIDGDGLTDFYVETRSEASEDHYVISGKDGSLSDSRNLPRPLYESVDGTGDDFMRMSDRTSDALDVTVRAGNGRQKVLWTYHRDGKVYDDEAVFTHFWAERFSKDRRADLMILTYGEDHDRITMLDGRDGHVRWTLSGPASY